MSVHTISPQTQVPKMPQKPRSSLMSIMLHKLNNLVIMRLPIPDYQRSFIRQRLQLINSTIFYKYQCIPSLLRAVEL